MGAERNDQWSNGVIDSVCAVNGANANTILCNASFTPACDFFMARDFQKSKFSAGL